MEPSPPRSAAEIDVEIRRLKKQQARAVSAREQRYRALLCDSLALEIARLEREKAHALKIEDQRRGALMRKYLAGRNAKVIRAALRHVVSARDAHLFEIAGV